jgi:hypothetical protein
MLRGIKGKTSIEDTNLISSNQSYLKRTHIRSMNMHDFMDKETEYRELLSKLGMSIEKVETSVESVKRALKYFKERGVTLSKGTVDDFRDYVAHLVTQGENSYDELVSVARYVNLLGMKEVYIYYSSILGGASVYPSIRERLGLIAGQDICDRIFRNVSQPPLGSDSGVYPSATKQLMAQLGKELSRESYRRVLAGNHHRIPVQAFEVRKKWLEEMGDVDAWLTRIHNVAVAELEEHLRNNRIWFEQVITRDIVDLVKGDQEILSGVRVGDWIYTKKIPFSPQAYIDEKDPKLKRYYMCHCPLAREAILSSDTVIPSDWCYCSAGYAKFRYDVAFGEETEVELLESVFDGSDKCRFRIRIPERWKEAHSRTRV